MDARTVEQRMAILEAHNVAHSLVLYTLVERCFGNDPAAYTHTRNTVCEAIERSYGESGLKPWAHDTLQMAIHEVEELFRKRGSSSQTESPQPDQP